LLEDLTRQQPGFGAVFRALAGWLKSAHQNIQDLTADAKQLQHVYVLCAADARAAAKDKAAVEGLLDSARQYASDAEQAAAAAQESAATAAANAAAAKAAAASSASRLDRSRRLIAAAIGAADTAADEAMQAATAAAAATTAALGAKKAVCRRCK